MQCRLRSIWWRKDYLKAKDLAKRKKEKKRIKEIVYCSFSLHFSSCS